MDELVAFLTNPFLLTGLSSWFVAQILKTVLHAVINKQWDWKRLVGDGGMPSGHSATVTAIALMLGLVYGFDSAIFALGAILAVIVCHDATGVRMETQKQAYLINELVKAFSELSEDKLPEVKLKKFVGHSPIQVMAGILLGIVNALIMHALLF